MTEQFQLMADARGDLISADGVVIDRSNGAVFVVGASSLPTVAIGGPAPHLSDAVEIPRSHGSTLLGGSGRNVIVSGLASLSGIYRPERPGFWSLGAFILEVTGSSAATIRDATDVVATLTTGGLAPAGSFVATSYGQSTYNSSSAFTLTAAKETGWPGTPNSIELEISEGTAMGGKYTTTDGVNYVSEADADWTLTVNADGSAELAYLTTVVAVRSSGDGFDPCGIYESTEDGKTLNPEFIDDPAAEVFDTNPFGTLTVVFNWSGTPDLDIGVTFLGETVGWGQDGSSPYMTWSGDNTSAGGPESVEIDLAAAWDAGEIDGYADITALADWFPPAGGSGPASLTVTYSLGGTTTHVLHPGSNTPAVTPALALRVLAAGGVSAVGGDWKATVTALRNVPRAGSVFLQITEAAGAVTGVTGPFFATSLPTPGTGVTNYVTATSDGAGGLRQIQTGPLLWGGSGGGGAAPFTQVAESVWVEMTPVEGTYYDVILGT